MAKELQGTIVANKQMGMEVEAGVLGEAKTQKAMSKGGRRWVGEAREKVLTLGGAVSWI